MAVLGLVTLFSDGFHLPEGGMGKVPENISAQTMGRERPDRQARMKNGRNPTSQSGCFAIIEYLLARFDRVWWPEFNAQNSAGQSKRRISPVCGWANERNSACSCKRSAFASASSVA